jgi:hypothetical protein
VGHVALDAIKREHRIFHLSFLEVYARETIRCVVTHALIDGTLEHCLDCTAGAMVHAITKLEIPERKLSVIEVNVQAVELRLVNGDMLTDLCIEPFQRTEVVALVSVVQRLAKIEIIQPIVSPCLADEQCRNTQQGWL